MTDSLSPTPLVPSPLAILGVPFDNVNTEGALARIEEMIGSRQPHYVVTANVDFLVQARDDIELRRILFDAHLVVADGMPLVWASRWLGNALPERVTGSGMTPLLLARAEAKGWRVFFLGGTEQSVAQAAANTRARHPRLQLVGSYSPPFKPLVEMDHEAILRRLRETQPDLLLVAFGCPKQEKWMNMHYRSAGVPVAIGVGATIDFLAGTVKRAPGWMQRAGLEWIFRLLQEPRRLFHRYVTGLWVFGWAILEQLRKLRVGPAPPAIAALTITPTADPRAVSVTLPERLTVEVVRAHGATWAELAGRSGDVLLDTRGVQAVDSTGMALLIRLQTTLRAGGRHLVLLAPGQALVRAFDLMRLGEFFARAADEAAALQLLAARRSESNVVAHGDLTGPSARIVWQGEITAANVKEVASATESCLAGATGGFEVDLAGVRFIDSSGIGLMVRLRKVARAQNLELRFIGATPGVRSVARLLRLEEFLFQPEP